MPSASKERPIIFNILEFGVRKALLIKKAQLEKMGVSHGFCKSILRDPKIQAYFIVKGREKGQGKRWALGQTARLQRDLRKKDKAQNF